MPGSYFEVIGQLKPAHQLHIIHLKEIEPPILLVKPPFLKSDNIDSSSLVNQSTKNLQQTPNMIQQKKSSNIVLKPTILKSSKKDFIYLFNFLI